MKPTKREIAWATKAINEQLDLIEVIRRAEGNREASGNATFGDTVQRMRRAIHTLKLAGAPMPTRLTMNWSHYRAIGWHSEYVVPAN